MGTYDYSITDDMGADEVYLISMINNVINDVDTYTRECIGVILEYFQEGKLDLAAIWAWNSLRDQLIVNVGIREYLYKGFRNAVPRDVKLVNALIEVDPASNTIMDIIAFLEVRQK